jgi:hypothetical protein
MNKVSRNNMKNWNLDLINISINFISNFILFSLSLNRLNLKTKNYLTKFKNVLNKLNLKSKRD